MAWNCYNFLRGSHYSCFPSFSLSQCHWTHNNPKGFSMGPRHKVNTRQTATRPVPSPSSCWWDGELVSLMTADEDGLQNLVARLPAVRPIFFATPHQLLCVTLQISSGPAHYSMQPAQISTPLNLAPLDLVSSKRDCGWIREGKLPGAYNHTVSNTCHCACEHIVLSFHVRLVRFKD